MAQDLPAAPVGATSAPIASPLTDHDIKPGSAVKALVRPGRSTTTYTENELDAMRRLYRKRPLAGRIPIKTPSTKSSNALGNKAQKFTGASGSMQAHSSSKLEEAEAARALVSLKTSRPGERSTATGVAPKFTSTAVKVHPPPHGTPPSFPVGAGAAMPPVTHLTIERKMPAIVKTERTLVATAAVSRPCDPIYTKSQQYYAANAMAKVWDESVEAIVDTGSNVTIISQDVLHKMGKMAYVHPVKLAMTVASGNSTSLLGSIRVPITLGKA